MRFKPVWNNVSNALTVKDSRNGKIYCIMADEESGEDYEVEDIHYMLHLLNYGEDYAEEHGLELS